MKILVVGGAGYIGSHVCWAFKDRGDQVTVLDNFSSGTRENVPPGCPVIEADLLDPPAIAEALSQGWDGVVHLAAFKAAGESMTEPEKYSVNNLSGTINLINAMTSAGSPPLVFSSSAAVFGEPEKLPIDENHPKNPENYYGFTKLEIERILDWYDKLKGLRSACLRYFNAAGYDPQGRVTVPESNPANLLPIVMEAAAGIRDKITVFGDNYDTPDGTCIRDYVHVTDLAEAHVLAMDYLIKEHKSLKVNLGSERGISVTEMVDHALEITGKAFAHPVGPRRPGDPAKLIASSTLARDLLSWRATRSDAATLISSTWELYRSK